MMMMTFIAQDSINFIAQYAERGRNREKDTPCKVIYYYTILTGFRANIFILSHSVWKTVLFALS